MLVNFDCSPLWVKARLAHSDVRAMTLLAQNKDDLIHAFNVDRQYLPEAQNSTVTEYRHWHVRLCPLP